MVFHCESLKNQFAFNKALDNLKIFFMLEVSPFLLEDS
jgi:hypothetical protein